jgi:hypothetical protein
VKTLAESLSYADALIKNPNYWYYAGGHAVYITAARRAKYPAIPVSKEGKLGIDCVWYVYMIARDGGWADPLSNGTPWNVGPMAAWAEAHMPHIPFAQRQAGDVAFFGTTHVAYVSSAKYVMQAYNEKKGLCYTTFAGVGLGNPTLIVRPPYGVVEPPVVEPPVVEPPVVEPPVVEPPAPPVVDPIEVPNSSGGTGGYVGQDTYAQPSESSWLSNLVAAILRWIQAL